MSSKIGNVVRRAMNGAGLVAISYGGIRSSYLYTAVRNSALEIKFEKGSSVYSDFVSRAPETIDLYLMLILAGMLLIVFAENFAKFLDRHNIWRRET